MSKISKTLLIVIPLFAFLAVVAYFYFSFIGDPFGDKEIELIKIKDNKNGKSYKISSCSGNATASSTLVLYIIENNSEKILNVVETARFYEVKKGTYRLNDTIINILLSKKDMIEIDTFQLITSQDTTYLQRKKRYQKH